ncbi:hypothetical protein [Lactiplantibacillus plantarum]|jgi:hypothetical protein|uniref:hypothetical protein n=1 Tax=Lactiplantibacillus plantarum TaxID=1590 RepID=UPI000A26F875|nr:hypothetical protein [Lactiplantibacillus plantarum]ASX21868.1 hypothetical protein BGV74_08750 [Lactiplantibacillus plantarum]WMY71861.1 hypothetical protein RF634_06595 [Lactiplantibacillus plantarum]
MAKALKQLVHVLWAIENDLHVIASNTEALKNQMSIKETIDQTIANRQENDAKSKELEAC